MADAWHQLEAKINGGGRLFGTRFTSMVNPAATASMTAVLLT